MARARNIKPGFFKNEDLAECSLAARLCFAGLWTLADREGRMEDRPKRIKGELFPFDAFEVEPLLQELARFKFIVRYEIEGERFIHIPEFTTHQTPHYSEKASTIKPPPLQEKNGHIEPPNSGRTPGNEPPSRGGRNPLNPDSLNPDSLIGTKKASSARGARLANDWTPGPEGIAFAEQHGLLNGRAQAELDRFRDYWTAQPGQKGVKADWLATWRNWCRKASEAPPGKPGATADIFAAAV
jgi:hypothetical protein